MILKLGMGYYELKLYTVHINDDPGLTLTYLTPMSNLAKLVFVPRCQVSVYRTIGPLVFFGGGGGGWSEIQEKIRVFNRKP